MHQNLATSYFLARQYENGIQAARIAVREAPDMGPAYTALALNLIGSGDVDGALATADTWRRVAPNHFEARLRDGYQMERPEDEHRTVTFLRIAAGLEDRSAADALR
jgi:hypothetical protein